MRWLMDAYRNRDRVVLWIKRPEGDERVVKRYTPMICIGTAAEGFLRRNNLDFFRVQRRTYFREWKSVLAVRVQGNFERFVSWLEKKTRHRIPLYDADIKPEQAYLYDNDLYPCSALEGSSESPPLKRLDLKVICRYVDEPVKKLVANENVFEGEEKKLLESFASFFQDLDPDVIYCSYAFSRIPCLAGRMQKHNISCPFHRWDPTPIRHRGGKSFYSYGRVIYRDYAVRLHGRFLVDSTSAVGTECDTDAIVELCQLSGMGFQQIASRSFGAVFQAALVRKMYRMGFLVPYKEKPIDEPMSMFHMVKLDRVGHTFDPMPGMIDDVAEIDFSSMFPWLMYNHNISADTMLCDRGPFRKVPGTKLRISDAYKGLVPLAVKPFIDRRMHYKRNPSALNKQKAVGLKWVLVSSYGYSRFREFKLGSASTHMAIGAYARETLLAAADLAERRGFEVVHGIVDSLFVRKRGMTEEEVEELCKEIEKMSGIPVSMKGIFRWVVFLSSVNDPKRPLPARYYGCFRDGRMKVRGIELRERGSPMMVKNFQNTCLDMMAGCRSKKEIRKKAEDMARLLRDTLRGMECLGAEWLKSSCRISTTDYAHNTPQKRIVETLKSRGVSVFAGMKIDLVYSKSGVVLPEDYDGRPDADEYRKLLVRSLYVLLQPFGYSRAELFDLSGFERQTRLDEYYSHVRHCYFRMQRQYASRAGLSERQIRKMLEKQGWEVWRGGLINILRGDELYPNVLRKYERLIRLLDRYHPEKRETLEYLCAVNHGMPDFICFRHGVFRFVECKLEYEQLSARQKRCIKRLQELGFTVEVHKLVERSRLRSAIVNIETGEKRKLEKQMTIRSRY